MAITSNLRPFKSPSGGFRGRSSFSNSFSVIILSFFAFSCSVRPPLTTETARTALLTAGDTAAGSIDSMQGSGSVEFGQNGERATVSFDIKWADDSAFTAEFSTMFGMTVASVRSKSRGTWIVSTSDSQYEVKSSENISIGAGFMSYPVTWEEFLSIITGRLPCASVFSFQPDSQFIDKKAATLLWRSRQCSGRTVDVLAKIDNKTRSLCEVSYNGTAQSGWSVQAGSFRNGRAKEFKFVQSNNNYFYVTYRSMKFHIAAGKRKAF
jgi:hypothetical protein